MKKEKIEFEDLEKSTEILGLIGLENRDMIKKKYLELSKKYHPDMQDGDTNKFQEVNRAYKIISAYVDNFRFRFTKDEFVEQFPYAFSGDKNWFRKNN